MCLPAKYDDDVGDYNDDDYDYGDYDNGDFNMVITMTGMAMVLLR